MSTLLYHLIEARESLRKAEEHFDAVAVDDSFSAKARGKAMARSQEAGNLSAMVSFDIGSVSGGSDGSRNAPNLDTKEAE